MDKIDTVYVQNPETKGRRKFVILMSGILDIDQVNRETQYLVFFIYGKPHKRNKDREPLKKRMKVHTEI